MKGLDSLVYKQVTSKLNFKEVIKMYKCNDCGAEFDEPESYSECVGEFWGMPAYEEFGQCPMCKSDDYDEILNNR